MFGGEEESEDKEVEGDQVVCDGGGVCICKEVNMRGDGERRTVGKGDQVLCGDDGGAYARKCRC